ncbi:O-phosphoseryl-tRNA selenium transferase [Dictyostelium discoideum AX4]|uniref:O-phosphoseryl-tRNA(Sec) selenium transferase n=1 Tax=Dictyostelium discoideum TaxID=44689 RepID=SPCS_DICDI|nr:O-phosphoseryl-tRNA selenium transferase [Dictyostelium discoideum AX4]Q54VQ6.1 RecName: Full=O-phosphoseryl-tRNA(Sec) selenium transferase; AltName: Full=Selenocysteine synthase; Short=Sec synthase; AltName: Full=Selenocysteinyl-tRNA(Sec) synthase; AltName: Full=Sep-tRNA:Sec-tRNA synthase; Short=SepSecS; AltName: Full=UGA suppressor tRNA-associated protein homolog [Dictyostelium discoideum]EAL67325.1 O-phosphoseryl-tRNA selenium transferase [Dictyostelium discoideum AX4]|eukprot:XP_641299.1 O-phosphoseryl-tRNA selenium transferase [Dictyostelium discoideum AX4]
MNLKNLETCKGLIKGSYIDQAIQGTSQFNKLLETLLIHKKLPNIGYNDKIIELILNEISLMDSNNFIENIGVGEREGRIYSGLVEKRHYGFAHGIGRSGDITEQQPKAAGSSLIQKLTHSLVLDAMKLAGLEQSSLSNCLLLPMATGMTLALTMLTLKSINANNKRYVLWPRIDQKSCLKSIITAGLIPIVIPNQLDGDMIRTDLVAIEDKIKELGVDNILCVFSTTSCFAPRVPDKIIEISEICKRYNIGHIINNAYGLQCSKILHNISQACKLGRVDAFIQSTDKNFMVPVGGAIISGPNSEFIDQISRNYPGRANSSPILDVFITLLSMGKQGWLNLLKERKELLIYFNEQLSKFALENNEKLLNTINENKISFALTLSSNNFNNNEEIISNNNNNNNNTFSMIGSKLFSRSCSGSRVIDLKSNKKLLIGGLEFNNYGSHIDNYSTSYLTVACAIGITKLEIDTFIQRLSKLFNKK